MADKYVNATGLRAVIDWILSAFTKKKDFDALEIGGRNILRGTKFNTISNTFISFDIGSGATCDVVNQSDSSSPSAYSLTITRTDSTTNYGGRYIVMPYKLTNGKVYTWNFYAKGSGSWEVGNEQNGQKTITLTSDYVRYNHTFTANNNTYYQFAFYTSTKNASITICGLKLEVGNKPTDWTPAPEDIETAISDVTNDCIKGLSVSDKTITYTKGDGSKGTITTQDTNTWRGIQDNLTSTSTTDSLSANQGKVLKGLVDGKADSSHTHNYAGSSSAGGAATSANWLNTNSSLTYGASGLQYFNQYTSTTSGAKVNANPTADWYYIIRMNYASNNGYFVDLSTCFHSDSMYYRRIVAGVENSWVRILDSANYKSYCTPANIGAAASSHTHSYAGSSSAGGSATSAVKLDSSAGSATQPVYFSNGKPVACSYTLGKSVPSDAVFTDTNTWRGIQNNLTSDSTTDSLAAAQGKALKALVDGKAASSHKHAKSDITDMPTSLPANGGNADTVDGKHATDIFNHIGLQTCGQVDANIRGCFNVNLTEASIGWLNVVQFEQGHFITQLGFSVGEPCSVFVRTRYAANSFTDWNTGWTNLGTNIVIGTSTGTIAYKSGYTKALIEFWKTTAGSASRTVYDAALITGLSSSMTAVTPSAISSGQDFAFALGNDASGGIIISGNFTKYKITYFN